MKKKISKTTLNSLSNYGLVIAIFIVVQLCSSAGLLSNQMLSLIHI